MIGEIPPGQGAPPPPSKPIAGDLPAKDKPLTLDGLRRIFLEKWGLDDFKQITAAVPERVPLDAPQMLVLGRMVPMMVIPRTRLDQRELVGEDKYYYFYAPIGPQGMKTTALKPLKPNHEYTVGKEGEIKPATYDVRLRYVSSQHCTLKVEDPAEGDGGPVLVVTDTSSLNGTYMKRWETASSKT